MLIAEEDVDAAVDAATNGLSASVITVVSWVILSVFDGYQEVGHTRQGIMIPLMEAVVVLKEVAFPGTGRDAIYCPPRGNKPQHKNWRMRMM